MKKKNVDVDGWVLPALLTTMSSFSFHLCYFTLSFTMILYKYAIKLHLTNPPHTPKSKKRAKKRKKKKGLVTHTPSNNRPGIDCTSVCCYFTSSCGWRFTINPFYPWMDQVVTVTPSPLWQPIRYYATKRRRWCPVTTVLQYGQYLVFSPHRAQQVAWWHGKRMRSAAPSQPQQRPSKNGLVAEGMGNGVMDSSSLIRPLFSDVSRGILCGSALMIVCNTPLSCGSFVPSIHRRIRKWSVSATKCTKPTSKIVNWTPALQRRIRPLGTNSRSLSVEVWLSILRNAE